MSCDPSSTGSWPATASCTRFPTPEPAFSVAAVPSDELSAVRPTAAESAVAPWAAVAYAVVDVYAAVPSAATRSVTPSAAAAALASAVAASDAAEAAAAAASLAAVITLDRRYSIDAGSVLPISPMVDSIASTASANS